MKTFEVPQKFSWTSTLSEMEIGGKMKIAAEVGRKTVAPRISREIKLMYPSRVYTTDCTIEPGFMIIERTA